MLDVQSHPRTKEPISERSKISLTKQRNIFEELNIYSLLLKDKQLRKKYIHVYYKNIVTDKNRRAIWVKTSKIKSLTSEWTTNIVPKIPVYIADLIRLCRADISHHKHWAVFPFPLSGQNTNRTMILSPLPSAGWILEVIVLADTANDIFQHLLLRQMVELCLRFISNWLDAMTNFYTKEKETINSEMRRKVSLRSCQWPK